MKMDGEEMVEVSKEEAEALFACGVSLWSMETAFGRDDPKWWELDPFIVRHWVKKYTKDRYFIKAAGEET